MEDAAHPDVTLVSVFKTSDPGVLPLATIALESEGIEYTIKNSGKADSLEWLMSQQPTNRPIVVEIFVTSDFADRARDLLVDLEKPQAILPTTDAEQAVAGSIEPPSIRLEDAVSGVTIGAIKESELQELTSRLEEDGPQQYFITGAIADMLRDAGVAPDFVDRLRQAAGAEGRAIRWKVQ